MKLSSPLATLEEVAKVAFTNDNFYCRLSSWLTTLQRKQIKKVSLHKNFIFQINFKYYIIIIIIYIYS